MSESSRTYDLIQNELRESKSALANFDQRRPAQRAREKKQRDKRLEGWRGFGNRLMGRSLDIVTENAYREEQARLQDAKDRERIQRRIEKFEAEKKAFEAEKSKTDSSDLGQRQESELQKGFQAGYFRGTQFEPKKRSKEEREKGIIDAVKKTQQQNQGREPDDYGLER